MKKLIALLLVSVFVAVATFAQAAPVATPMAAPAFVLSAGVETGLYYNIAKLGSGTGTLQLQDYDDTGFGTRAYVAALYDAKLYGLKTKLRVDYIGLPGAGAGTLSPYLAEGYAWVAPLAGQLTFKVGALTETALSTAGDTGFLSFDATYYLAPYTGASLIFAPAGLPLMVGILLPVDVLAQPENASEVLFGTTVAAKFVADKLFDVVVGYTFWDSPPDYTTPNTGFNNDHFALQAVSYGINLLAVPNLTFNAEGYLPINQGNQYILDEKVALAIDKLTISVLSYQFLKNGDTTVDSYATIKPYIGYDLGGVTPGLTLFYNFANEGTWAINPSVKFALGSGTFLIGASVGTNPTRSKSAWGSTDVGGLFYTGFEFAF